MAEPGEIVLIALPTAGGGPLKLRPALILCQLPGPTQTLLLAAVSTSNLPLVDNWDIQLNTDEPWFVGTGLHRTSAVRMSYLYAATESEIVGVVGSLPRNLHAELVRRLSLHIAPPEPSTSTE
jgi:hypothetical protein